MKSFSNFQPIYYAKVVVVACFNNQMTTETRGFCVLKNIFKGDIHKSRVCSTKSQIELRGYVMV
jgi:hypothetical protein